MRHLYTLDPGTDAERVVAIEPLEATSEAGPRGYRLTLDPDTVHAREVELSALKLHDGGYHLRRGPRSVEVDAALGADDVWTVLLGGQDFAHRVLNARQLRKLRASGDAIGANTPELRSPMAGKVIALLVEPGAAVEVGEPVMVIEAMKMENEIKAHRAGVVGTIHVSAGDAVDVGAELVSIADADAGDDA